MEKLFLVHNMFNVTTILPQELYKTSVRVLQPRCIQDI